MLGQFHRGELPELSSSRGTAAAPDAEAIVKRPPTEFERVIARRRAEGLTLLRWLDDERFLRGLETPGA